MLLVLLTAALWFSVAYSSPCKPLPIQVICTRAWHTCRAACLIRDRKVTGWSHSFKHIATMFQWPWPARACISGTHARASLGL